MSVGRVGLLLTQILHTVVTRLRQVLNLPGLLSLLQPGPGPGPGTEWAMEELTPRRESLRQLKARFLEALVANDAQEVVHVLRSTGLDIDTVLEVEDTSMLLASYKQGRRCVCVRVCVCLCVCGGGQGQDPDNGFKII